MDNAENWKHKYFESLEKLDELEHKTKSWEELENLLRLAMNRVAVAVQGVDPVLDKHLKALRKAVRGGDYPDLESIIENISATVKRVDEQRQLVAAQGNSAPQLLKRLVDQLQFPKQQKKRVKMLRQTIQSLDETQSFDDVLRDLAALINDIFSGEPDDSSNTGLLARWFAKANQTNHSDFNGDEKIADQAGNFVASGQPPELESPAAALPACSALQSKRYQNISWGDNQQQLIANFCLRLLEALHFPEEFYDRVQALREVITEGFAIVETGSLIEKIADLVTATRVRLEKEKHELQDFLLHLTEYLQEIDKQLSGAENRRRASMQNHQTLDDAVQEQVSIIETSVNGASELAQLKTDIQTRLLTIREYFKNHRKLEEQQQKELQQALEQSNQRLQVLEQESRQLRQRLNQEHQQAIHDTLTGLHNRLAYEERMEQEYMRWKRYQQPLVLLLFDIDYFKRINDTYGHKAGDKALKLIAKTLQKNLREADFLARYGGEEFIVLMPQTELGAAIGAADKLREAVLANQFHYQQERVHISISCGATQFGGEDTIDQVFQRADQALYQAKQNGRNRCEAV